VVINYLILAHADYRHLDSLINALDDKDVFFFIHIDKKAKVHYQNSKNNVFILKERITVNWGGFSMVEATLNLMEFAVRTINEGYYCLISGGDYPIKNNDFVKEALSKNCEYIDILPAPLQNKPMKRFKFLYFDIDRRNKNLSYYFYTIVERSLRILYGKRDMPFEIFVGSQWFALTKECVDYILNTIKNRPEYIRFFRYTLVPDEAFFQTIIGNSEFYSKTKPNLTFQDWNAIPAPAMISGKHIELFKQKSEFEDDWGRRIPFFTRKFNDQSKAIIERIERELRN
jgi:hypothetical protein